MPDAIRQRPRGFASPRPIASTASCCAPGRPWSRPQPATSPRAGRCSRPAGACAAAAASCWPPPSCLSRRRWLPRRRPRQWRQVSCCRPYSGRGWRCASPAPSSAGGRRRPHAPCRTAPCRFTRSSPRSTAKLRRSPGCWRRSGGWITRRKNSTSSSRWKPTTAIPGPRSTPPSRNFRSPSCRCRRKGPAPSPRRSMSRCPLPAAPTP